MAEIQGQQPLENENLQHKEAEGEHHLAHALNEVGSRVAAEGQMNIQGDVSSLEGAIVGRPELAKLLKDGSPEQLQSFIDAKQKQIEAIVPKLD